MEIIDGKDYILQVKQLIKEYTGRLNRDLSFQNLKDELSNLKEKYTAPNGKTLAAVDNDEVLGMVAYKRHSDVRCEMKRLYVIPSARGLHLGDALVKDIIDCAKTAGYKEMVLDTLKPMKAAIHLYKKYGFDECEPYYCTVSYTHLFLMIFVR